MAAVGRSRLVTVGPFSPVSSNVLSPHAAVVFEHFLQEQVNSRFKDLICDSSQMLAFNLCFF